MKAQGSGLSLERFIRGKARPNKGKGESAAGKRKRVEKAVLLRKYRKEVGHVATNEEAQTKAPTSFYDKFFSQVQGEENDASHEKTSLASLSHKPDPLFKAKRKAQQAKDGRHKKRQVIEEKVKEKEKKVEKRKKRHVKLSLRTKTGQPVVKHQIKDILAKLKATAK
ncbi:unnamed protein product [Aphanomyces euteiches]